MLLERLGRDASTVAMSRSTRSASVAALARFSASTTALDMGLAHGLHRQVQTCGRDTRSQLAWRKPRHTLTPH